MNFHSLGDIEALLQAHAGLDLVVYDDGEHPLHPQAVFFHADSPRESLSGFGGRQVLELNLLLDSADDDHLHRVERTGSLLIYLRYDRKNRATYAAFGQVLVCEPGSDNEQVFLVNVASTMLEAAAEPLRSATAALRAAGLQVSPTYQSGLVGRIFPL